MDRYNFEEHISAYIDGELSEVEKKEFEKLIESTPECRIKYKEVNSLVSNLRSMPKLKTNDNFMRILNEKIHSHNKSKVSISNIVKKYFSPSSGRPVIGFAMSFAAIFMIYLYFNLDINGSNITSSPLDTNSENEIYYSDIDSTESDEYEDEIQLTKGSK